MHSSYRKTIIIVVVIIALAGSFLFGIYIGVNNRSEIEGVETLFNKEVGIAPTADFEPFWKVWNIVNEKYVSSDGPTDEEKVFGAIEGLVGSLGDPYSVFLPPMEAERFASDISGEFQGVGMEIGIRDGILTVIAPLKDTPAFRAGVKSGDKIISIDNTMSADVSIDEAVRLIRGPKRTEVVLTVIRGSSNEPIEISITRDVISIPTTNTEIRLKTGEISSSTTANNGNQSEVFVLSLYNFSGNSANIFRESLREFVLSGKNKLILDLRGNPGGFLEASVDIASWFLPAGKVVVREEGPDGVPGRVYRSKGYDIFTDELEMVILIDGGSASASEILAGALSEHGVAKLVGAQTFGKGSVQELVSVTDNTALKITVARWLTPNGISISEEGIAPDVAVEITPEDIEENRDAQLLKAIELLAGNELLGTRL